MRGFLSSVKADDESVLSHAEEAGAVIGLKPEGQKDRKDISLSIGVQYHKARRPKPCFKAQGAALLCIIAICGIFVGQTGQTLTKFSGSIFS